MSRRLVIPLGAVGAIALLALGGWWFFLRGDEPPPVSLADAVASVGATAISTTTPTGTGTAMASGAATEPASGPIPLEGVWMVDPAQSFLGYRIDEELASIGSTTAVGRTSDIEGMLEFDGSAITAVSITADVSTLESDDSRRDGQLRRQALESSQFPEASFVLTEPIAVGDTAASGDPISATAVGDLTIHGVTNRVEMQLEGQMVDGQVVVVGSTIILLADYDIDAPQAMSVVSVADEATIEVQLVFSKA